MQLRHFTGVPLYIVDITGDLIGYGIARRAPHGSADNILLAQALKRLRVTRNNDVNYCDQGMSQQNNKNMKEESNDKSKITICTVARQPNTSTAIHRDIAGATGETLWMIDFGIFVWQPYISLKPWTR